LDAAIKDIIRLDEEPLSVAPQTDQSTVELAPRAGYRKIAGILGHTADARPSRRFSRAADLDYWVFAD
jgi:hypothetical protein